MRDLRGGAAFRLIFSAITNLHQFPRGDRRFDRLLIERETKLSETPPFLQLIVLDVGALVLREPRTKTRRVHPGGRRSRCETRRSFPAPAPRDPLLDEPAAQIGINQTAFGGEDGFDKRRIRQSLTVLKTREAFDLVNPSPHSNNYSSMSDKLQWTQ
jgi:hypothetical protein